MNSTTYRSRLRLTTALALAAGAVVGLLAACSSDGNPSPSGPPVINTGGGGSGGSVDNDAGESSSVGGSRAGSGNHQAGASNGGSSNGEAGEGGGSGEGGEAGTGPIAPECPSTDLGFLNQPSNSQKAPFDNAKRLGAQASLPPLP